MPKATQSEDRVTTGVVRLSFPYVFQKNPKGNSDGKTFYTLCLLIPKSDTDTVNAINKAIEFAKEVGKTSKWAGKIPKNLETPLHDGDEDRDSPEFENHFFLNCKSTRKPQVIDRHKNPITDEDEMVAGDYALVSLNFYPYDKSKGGKDGIGVGLNNIMFWKKGEPFGSSSKSAKEDFAHVEETIDDEDDDLS